MRTTASPFVSGQSRSSHRALDAWSLARLARALGGAPVALELWDGTRALAGGSPPVATITIGDRRTLVHLLVNPSLAFGEAYADGRLEVDGSLETLLESVNRALGTRPYPGAPRRRHRNSAARARRNARAHYDVGNDFYRLWLDESMAYTCAYYSTPDATLEEAQRAKFDHVCRKLELQPGQRVVEAGCGWGGLALHMARHYGVTVQAYNVSEAQLAFARDRAQRLGLSDRVTFVGEDYRAIEGRADAFVSVGMLEHVGPGQYAALGAIINRVLDPGRGRGLLHFIGRNVPMEFNAWITRHVFPGAYAPTLAEVATGVLEPQNLSVLDVENLRLHYARTLREWLARFEAHADEVQAVYDARLVRTWRLYLSSAAAAFQSGHLQLFQVTFGRPGDDTHRWTRDALYQPQTDASV